MSKTIFNPNTNEPYVLSRTRVHNFLDCPSVSIKRRD